MKLAQRGQVQHRHYLLCLSAGIVLDPVYSGKALFNFAQDVGEDPAAWEGRTVLFLHTGAACESQQLHALS